MSFCGETFGMGSLYWYYDEHLMIMNIMIQITDIMIQNTLLTSSFKIHIVLHSRYNLIQHDL